MSKLSDIVQSKVSPDNLWTPFSQIDIGDLRDLHSTILANCSDGDVSVSDLVLMHSVFRACQKNGLRLAKPSVDLESLSCASAELNDLNAGNLFALGSMFYEDENFANALSCFEICFSVSRSAGLDFDEIFPVQILAAYTCENLGLERHDVAIVKQGLGYLEEIETSTEIKTNEAACAELYHALGHLHVAHEILGSESTDVTYGLGGKYLKKASDMNPEFLSCYTASHSEVGQFEKTAAETIRILSERDNGKITLGRTSEMELLFYLASSYLFLGEYELSRRTYELFRVMAEAENLTESIDYSLFFLEKIETKKNFLQEYLDNQRLDDMEVSLSRLSFRSYQSEKLRVDCEAHIECLKNLSHSIGASRKDLSVGLLRHWIDEAIRSIRLLGLSETPLVAIYAENSTKRKKARDYFKEIGSFIEFVDQQPTEEAEYAGIVAFYEPSKNFKTKSKKVLNGKAYGVWLNDENGEGVFLLGLYLLLANRILSSVGDYIFRLSPCEDATTTKSQRPQISLGRLTEQGLANHAFGL